MENSAAVGFENVKVFAADPWYEAQPGSIKNLKISVKGNITKLSIVIKGSGLGSSVRSGQRIF